jgi:Tfp pilus assembly protein PilN
MININLIIKPPPKLRWRPVLAAVVAGAAIMGTVAYGLIWWQEYRQLRADVAELAPLEADYQKRLSQSAKVKEQEDLLAKQEQRLADIARNQAPHGQAAVLRAVFAAAPADVAVTDVNIDREQTLLLTGQAPSFEAAMAYLRALQALPGLTAVEERKLTTAVKGVTTFTFAGKVRREGQP